MDKNKTTETVSVTPEKITRYVKVKTVETGSPLFKSNYSTLNVDQRHFASLDEAKAHIKEKYGKAKRSPIYVDGTNGEARKVGYCYKFRNADWSHAPVEKWNQCDWVEISEVEEIEAI